ncbi:MAG: MOP flippase family protein [Proteobacteria bacterium]|nr:MOP flippase family protein [Sideroxydans sp.]MBU4154375.1 MOP flippase family protein [Pseudomonadota bacterium]
MTLRKQAYSGVRWSTASSLIRACLQLLQIAVLARLLAPADFGLMALVVAMVAFLQVFSDMGVSSAIIHHQEIDQRQLSSLYWLNAGAALGLAIILVLASPFIANFYGDSRLVTLTWIAGATLVVAALGQQIRVLAEKNLQFFELARVEVFSAGVALVVAIFIAMQGGGVYALVGGVLANAIVLTALLWIFLARGWRPLWCFSLKEIRQFLGFGAYMIGNNLINTFNSQVDILLGGRVLGAQAIGLYSLPRDLCLRLSAIFNPIAIRVGFPVMAKAQNDIALLKNIYLKTMRMTASINFPFYIVLAVFAPEVVHILFGEKWEEAIPLLRIFALWGLLRAIGNPVGILLLARGRADLSFKWNLWMLFVYSPVVLMGSQFGVKGMALSMLFAGVALFPANWYWLVRPLSHAKFGEYLIQMFVPFIISVVSGLAGYISAYPFEGDVIRLVVGTMAGGAAYGLLSIRLNKEWFSTVTELAIGWK